MTTTEFSDTLRREVSEGRRAGQFECSHNEYVERLSTVRDHQLHPSSATVIRGGYRVSWYDPMTAQRELFSSP